MTEKQLLFEHAKAMRNAAPTAFEQFRKAFEVYAQGTVMGLVDIDGDFQFARGRAKQTLALLEILNDCK